MNKKPVAVTLYRPGTAKVRILKRFNEVHEAEEFIGRKATTDPVGVYRGDCGIDAPETMVNGR